MEPLVRVEKSDGIATIMIDNPPMNVMSNQVLTQLAEIFSELEIDAETVVVILTGVGNRAFMAGADIKEFPQLFEKPDVKEHMLNTHRIFNQIENLPKPTIALLNGFTFGGGCELALTCDMRIAESHVQLGLPEVKLGIFPGGGGTQRLPRLVGAAKAKEIMFTGEPISAEDALQIGLVNHVVPSGAGIDSARALAKKIGGYSIQSLSRIKRAVNEGMALSLTSALDLEAELFADVFKTEDVREGVQAFIEKRAPIFRNK